MKSWAEGGYTPYQKKKVIRKLLPKEVIKNKTRANVLRKQKKTKTKNKNQP